MTNEKYEYMQSPTAKLVDVGDGNSVLVLEDWNIEDEISGYTIEEVKSLIKMLEESVSIMDRYHRANAKLPLFENLGDYENVPEKAPPLG